MLVTLLRKSLYCCLLLTYCFSCSNNTNNGKKVFRYGDCTNIARLDAGFPKYQSIIWAVHQLFNTLVETNGNLESVLSVVSRWDVLHDRTVYCFHLRKDVFF